MINRINPTSVQIISEDMPVVRIVVDGEVTDYMLPNRALIRLAYEALKTYREERG